MKAAQISKYGGPEVIEINDATKPELSEGQILIEVHAASLNPFDTTVRNGYMQQTRPLDFPATMGGDFAGIVREVSEGVGEVAVGDEVYGEASLFAKGSGSFAEFATADPGRTAPKPKTLDFKQAAALPLVGSSAIQALIEHINPQQGQKILIHGGAGGIGSIAIQLAKHLGAWAATTVATDEMDFARKLGADEIIDYKTEQFQDKVSDLDAVYDTVGKETYTRSFAVLKKGGVIVSMIEKPNQELMDTFGVTAISQFTRITTDKLEKLAELVDKGVIKPQVDKVFPLEETAEAFTYRETHHPRGKVVLAIK